MNGYIKQSACFAMTLLAWSLMALSAQAASFDCAKASTKVEHLICGNAELSKMDDELATNYNAALQNWSKATEIKKAQRLWLKKRNNCEKAKCVRKSYETRLASLKLQLAQNPDSTNKVKGDPSGINQPTCNSEEQLNSSSIRIQDIAGLYRQSVNGLPAYVGEHKEKRSGYNYLAIIPLTKNRIRVRLSSKEINGHDCGVDSEALLCGHIIKLMPTEEEMVVLKQRKLPVPRLRITTDRIAFTPYANGNFIWGSPYCGAMGYLRQSFSRDTRKLKFDDAVFNQ